MSEEAKTELETAKEFCKNWDSQAKHLIQGVSDPLLHSMMQDYAEYHLRVKSDLIGKLKEAILLYDEYLEFLIDANQEPIQLASIQGYKFPQYLIDKGQEYRDKIESLITLADKQD